MKNLFIALISCFVVHTALFGQGTLRGKVLDENGEPLTGTSIVLKSQLTVGTVCDLSGQYSLKINSTGPQVILVSFMSYRTIEDTISLKNGEVLIRNYNMQPASSEISEVVILGQANKSKDIYMEKIQTRSAVSLNYISSEMIKKTGDTNVSSAVARVSGVSTNGSFISVRGIGDRYMKTAINGSRIPTLDPFTNNIKLDMFPASLVDNIVITKTASPDLPGDWAGAYLSVETKNYPDKLSVNIETSFGYNQQSTFKDVVTSQRSSTDWLGFDDGMRDINHGDFIPVKQLTTHGGFPYNDLVNLYDEFIALGLGDFFKSLGVTHIDNDASLYAKLGYIQLGLMGTTQIDDPVANAKAKALFDKEYKPKADRLVNAAAIQIQNKLFPNNWNATHRRAPLNFSQSFSVGNQSTLFGMPCGYLFGLRYASSMQYDPNFKAHNFIGEDQTTFRLQYDTIMQGNSKETNGWSALLNLSVKYHPNNSISLLFMPNVIGVNNVRDGNIYNWDKTAETFDTFRNHRNAIFYEQRKQLVYQVKSEHYLPGPRLKIELNASYTNGSSVAPDFKSVVVGNSQDDRYFRYLLEDVLDSRLSFELPLGNATMAGTTKLKFGTAYQYNSRKSDQYDYEYWARNESYYVGNVDTALRGFYYINNDPSNHSIGYSKIKAGFIMLDVAILPAIRFSGGVRLEQANMLSDNELYYNNKIPDNDTRRIVPPARFNEVNYLPSGNLIIKLKRDEAAPINLRFGYSQSLARPSIRELSIFRTYDYELDAIVQGNNALKQVQIKNYDVRLEAYFASGDNVSVSFFYKDFKNHIEAIQVGSGNVQDGIIWKNSSSNSWLKGIELEGKKNIIKQLECRFNVSLINSFAKINKSYTTIPGNILVDGETVSHTMLGQAPYVINGILSYHSDKIGLAATLSYNRQGARLVRVGLNSSNPDVYEMPRNLLDFKVSQSIGKHFNASLKIQDLLKTSIVRSYKLEGSQFHHQGFLVDYDKYTWGISYVFALSYSL